MEIINAILTALGYALLMVVGISLIGIPIAFLMAKYDDKIRNLIEKIITKIRRHKK